MIALLARRAGSTPHAPHAAAAANALARPRIASRLVSSAPTAR